MGITQGMTFKEKVDYFWYYYKWYVIVIACLIAAIVYTVISCRNQVKPDLNVLIISDVYVDEEYQDNFREKYTPFITDVNGDGKKNITFTVVQFSAYSSPTMNPELEYASEQQLKANIMNADNQLIIFKDNVEDYLTTVELFTDLSEYKEDKDYILIDEDDRKLLGLIVNDYYAGIRVQPDNAKEEEQKMYVNAFNVLEQMMK